MADTAQLLALLAALLLLVNGEASSKPVQKAVPKTVAMVVPKAVPRPILGLANRLPFLRMFNRPAAAAAVPVVHAIDLSAEDQWAAAFPNPTVTMEVIRPDTFVANAPGKADTIYTLKCEVTMKNDVPEYQLYFEYGTQDAGNAGGNNPPADRKWLPLGFYTYKTGAKLVEFTANEDNLLSTKHIVLDEEKTPAQGSTHRLFFQFGGAAKPEPYRCRLRIPSTKHPYNIASAEQALK